MNKKSMGKIHHSLKNHELDENGIIYLKGNPLPFSKEFKYAGKTHKIERLIARIFIPNPNNCGIVVFKDGNINNIQLNNLEWSSYDQDSYNFAVNNSYGKGGKYCKKCKIYKEYSEYDSNSKGNKLNFCKSCLKERRNKNKDEYNKRRNLRRKSSNTKTLDNIKRYQKLKEDPEKYKEYLNRVKEYNKKNWWIYILSRLKRRANSLNLPFNLTKEDLILVDVCPILEIPISLNNENKLHCISWDRIIPELGYVKGNVKAISLKANIMKSDCSIDEIETFCKNIIPYISKR